MTQASSSASSSSSDFYYDNWRCNNYLSAKSVEVHASTGQLLEIHIRDNIPVSMSVYLALSVRALEY